jgi:hypothetical protein
MQGSYRPAACLTRGGSSQRSCRVSEGRHAAQCGAGASAIADRCDAVLSAFKILAGRVEHFGMPVDERTLFLVGIVAGKPSGPPGGCSFQNETSSIRFCTAS